MRLTSTKVIKGLQQVKERKEPNYHGSALSWLFSVKQLHVHYRSLSYELQTRRSIYHVYRCYTDYWSLASSHWESEVKRIRDKIENQVKYVAKFKLDYATI